ncbi:ribosomal RNA small subunit methyltransferase A [Candidatus Micrarchaeota archaeon CG10_big_fil_rev_8_21_14_0_10_45_29]|nr:MAG: ribosomal RNA small subunit methyltransferase A [Candidatus Micrarchaeota archaeon CG10_big_fil_rev_8_21_14_0_10_45_29]
MAKEKKESRHEKPKPYKKLGYFGKKRMAEKIGAKGAFAKIGSNSQWKPQGLSREKSQHFLIDEAALKTEAGLLKAKGKSVLEIGAGDGRLSKEILACAPKSLTLVELDAKWANFLKHKFRKNKNVKIKNKDFLTISDKCDAQIISGNVPYNISSSILLKLSKLNFSNCILCMQKEVVERICAPPATAHYGRLSAFCQLHFSLTPLFEIPASSFHPPPKVDSRLLQLTPKKERQKIPKNFEKISAALFSHRLATVQNALFHSRKAIHMQKGQAREFAKSLKTAGKKVFMLSPQEILHIAKMLEEK